MGVLMVVTFCGSPARLSAVLHQRLVDVGVRGDFPEITTCGLLLLVVVGWLLHVPATSKCISGTGLLIQL